MRQAMADPGLLGPASFDSLPGINPSDFPAIFDPLSDGAVAFDDLDFDLDGLDFDFPIDNLLSDTSPQDLRFSSDAPSSAVCSPSSSPAASSDSGHVSSVSSVVTDEGGSRRKRGHDDDPSPNYNPNPNPNPNPNAEELQLLEAADSACVFSPGSESGEKRKARLMRNRESAQQSRQRKKQYVGELEEKVRLMHSTIAELNGKISCVLAENASLRQKLCGGGANFPPQWGIYPPPMAAWAFPGYVWPQGSRAPQVPIPRVKVQQPIPVPKARKSESKKAERKIKKLASVSLLGLFCMMLVFGCLIPAINHRHGGSDCGGNLGVNGGISDHPQKRVLLVSGLNRGPNSTDDIGSCSAKVGDHVPTFTHNSSQTLPALLYVPRDGKHVKIDGKLIIHSVLASEKAVAEQKSGDKRKKSMGKNENATGLVIVENMALPLASSQERKEVDMHLKSYRSSAEHHRDAYGDTSKSIKGDGQLQQWFREGLAGPILSSGMCTEVFQFEVSPSSVIPASIVNATDNFSTKSACQGNMRNRRILHPQPIPLNGSTLNDTKHVGKNSDGGNFPGNASAPPMVVSILADPREAGDGDVDGLMPPKSLSRIFVVVLVDSVKYVTYSCVLPFKSSSPHLVN